MSELTYHGPCETLGFFITCTYSQSFKKAYSTLCLIGNGKTSIPTPVSQQILVHSTGFCFHRWNLYFEFHVYFKYQKETMNVKCKMRRRLTMAGKGGLLNAASTYCFDFNIRNIQFHH